MSEMQKIRNSFRDNNANTKRINTEIHNITQWIKGFMEAEKIAQLLQIQDEEDRHSIALWGANKLDTTPKRSPIKQRIDETLDKMNMTTFTQPQTFLNSTNEFPSPNRNREVQTSLKVLDTKRSKISESSKPTYEQLTQRSSNFAPKSSRHSKSVKPNPLHFRRSLPSILQTKNSKNAAGIVKISNS
jgi:hypothetical protein